MRNAPGERDRGDEAGWFIQHIEMVYDPTLIEIVCEKDCSNYISFYIALSMV